MTVLVVGGTGDTGKHVIEKLLSQDVDVRAIVRDVTRVPEEIQSHENLELVEASLLNLSEKELKEIVDGCTAIVSCLGHGTSFSSIFGPPFRLVKNAVKRLTTAIDPASPVKVILMNSVGVRNPDSGEKHSFAEKLVTGIIRVLVPPHADNEQAAKYLRVNIGQDHQHIQWVVVRPDSLINELEPAEYAVHPMPTRSGLFDPGQTNRANVAQFMVDLLQDDTLWDQWKGQMPVIYNAE